MSAKVVEAYGLQSSRLYGSSNQPFCLFLAWDFEQTFKVPINRAVNQPRSPQKGLKPLKCLFSVLELESLWTATPTSWHQQLGDRRGDLDPPRAGASS